jgi:hypothetical protein
LTTTITSSTEDSNESDAVNRNVYVPAAEKLAAVVTDERLAKVTVPGPLTSLQFTVSVLPLGWPSSLAAPNRFTPADKVVV